MTEKHDDFTMAYQDTCDQMVLLLVHGFPLDSAMWEFQLQDLADVARVIAPDLRGHGRSDSVPGPYSMKLFSDDIAGLLDYLNVSEPVVVCGLSMGGYIALDFYRRYPERVAGLILTATRAGADSEEGKAGRDKSIAAVEAEGTEPVIAGMLPKLMAPDSYEDDELVDFVKEIMEGTSVEGMIGALQAIRDRPDSTPTLGKIAVPTLIIHGENDQIIPIAEAEAMYRAIEEAEMVVVENAGHLPNLEQPDIFNDAVVDFLEELMEDDLDHHNGHHH
ncbi:MAG: alpha/beta fold hydrolase [Ardenticatenaceae bacterium]|nr:alpha/beta fold hydrolase [Ardenticatenaceae bacterium]